MREALLHGDNDDEEVQKKQKFDSCSIQKQFEILQDQNNRILGKDSFLGNKNSKLKEGVKS